MILRHRMEYRCAVAFILLLLAVLHATILLYSTFHAPVAVQDISVSDTVTDTVLPENGAGFPVHIVRFYKEPPHGEVPGFCWTECLSILSVMLYVRPSRIYIHTNFPDYWPFDRCYMITNYSNIHFAHVRQRLTLSGKRIDNSHHEADFVKYTAVYKYGGLSTDTDVFYLPAITSLINKWRKGQHECLLSQEDHFMNSGFIACQKGHPYIKDVLTRYQNNYRVEWLHNSGHVPWQIYLNNSHYQERLYVDSEMANHTFEYSGAIRYKEIPAWHSYYHECTDTYANTYSKAVNSSFWEMLHFIHDEGWKLHQFPTTPKAEIEEQLLELKLLKFVEKHFRRN